MLFTSNPHSLYYSFNVIQSRHTLIVSATINSINSIILYARLVDHITMLYFTQLGLLRNTLLFPQGNHIGTGVTHMCVRVSMDIVCKTSFPG